MATKMAHRFLSFFFFFFAAILFFIADAVPVVSDTEPEALPSFVPGLIQFRGKKDFCPYSVIITTSCHSPTSTGDHISIVFGDNYGKKVYAPRLDFAAKPSETSLFERCSSDTFQIKGPCASQICYVYLYRTGPYGWVPETIEIYGEGSKAVKFDFNKTVPEDKWYGHNFCNDSGSPPPLFPPYRPPLPPPPPPPEFPPPPPEFPPPPPEFPPPPPVRPSAASGRRPSKLVILGGFAAAAVLAGAAMVL